MTGSLSGVGQPQIPLSQPYQPGGSDQTRQVKERESQDSKLQVRGTATAQKSEEKQEVRLESKSLSSSVSNDDRKESQKRGSLVDITV